MYGKTIAAVALAFTLVSCSGGESPSPEPTVPAGPSFRVLSGSENETLEPILKEFARANEVDLQIDYKGSVDIMIELGSADTQYDAVWPANSLWVALGDEAKRVRDVQSIMRSPVVLAVKKPVALKLGWVGKDVTVADILAAAEGGRLRFMMTSATQSNSGASAYFGFLSSFAGNPDVITSENLRDPALQMKIRTLLSAVNRSAGSSGWLKDLFLKEYEKYDAMVNYEAVVIEANRELVSKGRDPLYAIYPVDGLTIADSPLGYLDRGDASKKEIFQRLQKHLLSDAAQKQILAQGRRVGMVDLAPESVDKAIFNPDWGIDAARILAPIRFPQEDVIREALDLYQTSFRKPSFTVYCIDVSGSMEGQALEDLKTSMRMLLQADSARRYLLQASPRDVTIIIPFSSKADREMMVIGNDPAKLDALYGQVSRLDAGGGTDIYSPVMRAFQLMAKYPDLEQYFPAVILMTDGKSNEGRDFNDLTATRGAVSLGADVPVFAIMFGDAAPEQLQQIAEFTSGRVFDGKKDLVKAFRQAKGYN